MIVEKQKAKEFPSAPVSVLRASLKRFPVLAFEGSDADLIAENLNGVIRSCQNDK